MADADVTLPGTGTKVDTRTVGAGTDEHRQVMVQGSPTVAANVAEVYTEGDAVGTASGATVLGRIHLTDPSSLTDLDAYPLTINRDGRLRVSTKPGWYADVTGNLTTSGTSLAADVGDVSNVMLHVKNSGGTNMTAGAFAFEGSVDSTDGSNGTWFAIQVVRSNANTIETATGTLTINAGVGQTYAWEASVNALKWMRVRCTTTVTASSTAAWKIVLGSYATEPVPAAQVTATQPVSGTVGVTGYPTAAAAADTYANPTITHIGADQITFNGSTWERNRSGSFTLNVDTSSARTATGNGTAAVNYSGHKNLTVWINVTAVTGSTPTCVFKLQWSPDNGTTWIDWDTTNLQTTSITGTTTALLKVGVNATTAANAAKQDFLPRQVRLQWTIGGGTPSFTFATWYTFTG